MNCEEAKELIPSYSLGALDKDESEGLEEHLTQCGECGSLYLELAEVAAHIPFATQDFEIPLHLKARLFARIAQPKDALVGDSPSGAEPRTIAAPSPAALPTPYTPARRSILPWSVAAVSLAASLLLAVWVGAMQSRVGQLEDKYQAVNASLEQQYHELEDMSTSATLVKGLEGTPEAPDAKGMMFLSATRTNALVVVFGLPPMAGDKTYQLWLISDGTRVSGGMFTVNERGYGMAAVEAPVPLKSYKSVGVTDEPKGGSAWPTGKKVMGGELRTN